MVFTTRSPVQLALTPSSAPYEIMAASQQAHIDELVQQNRTIEHTVKKLQQALQEEKERGIDVVKRLKAASQEERVEWREGCDSLLGSHRIVHLRTRIELDKAQMLVLKERDKVRKERLMVLQRDYKLTLFQAKETDLDARVAELEEELEELKEQNKHNEAMLSVEHEGLVEMLRKELTKVEAEKNESAGELENARREKEKLHSEISNLTKANEALHTTVATTSTQLERTSLQLDGAKTSLAELKNANGELTRTNADIKRQLDKWQNLETKGGAEMEELRKRRIELEVNVKELEGRVKESEEMTQEATKTLEKERKKVDKWKMQYQSLFEESEQAQELAILSQTEAAETLAKLASAQKLIAELRLQLEGDAESTKPPVEPKRQRRAKHRPEPEPEPEIAEPPSDDAFGQPPGSEREVEIVVTPAPRTRPQPRPAYKSRTSVSEAEEAVEDMYVSIPENKAKEREKPLENVGGDQEKKRKSARRKQDSDADEVELPYKNRGKRRAQEGVEVEDEALEPKKASRKGESNIEARTKDKGKAREKDASETEEDQQKASRTRKGKAKTKEASETEEDEPRVKRKGKANDDSEADEAPVSKRKAPTRSKVTTKSTETSSKRGKPIHADSANSKPTHPEPDEGDGDDSEEAPQPKKKKKRIFAPSQPMAFAWGSLPQGDGGLNIPTELSPVKDSDVVPARSLFGRMASVWGK